MAAARAPCTRYPDSNDEGTVDVFSTSAWALRHPQVAATFNPATQNHGTVIVDAAVPSFVYSTNLAVRVRP
jgi:hypothetical protein